MTALHRDLSAPEIWQRSVERSRRRRAVTPKLRRQVVRRKRASTAMAAALLAGPAAQFAGAQTPSEGSGSGGSGIASESPANRAIAGGHRATDAMLSIGSAGEAVKAVQSELGLEASGVFDEKTDGTVRDFQADGGLEVDGIVGPKTWGALFGGGTGPAADSGNSAPVLVPSSGGTEQRTSFAVRRAADDELEKVGGAELQKPKDQGAGLAAIELRLPADESGEESSDSSAKASARARSSEDSGSVARSSEENDDSSSSGNSGSSGDPDRGDSSAGSGADSEKPSGGSSRSGSEGNAGSDSGKDRGESKGGACDEKLKWPTTGRNITSTYGDGRDHGGVDIDGGRSDEGNPVYAAACGVISLISPDGKNSGYGNFACVKHSDRFVTCYAHLSGFANVREGDYVRRGQTIGYVGNTGKSFGAHLHFEVRNGTPYRGSGWPKTEDPMPYLEGREIPGSAVRASSRGDTGGPDEQQAKQAWTAKSESSTEERSAVAIATDRDESLPAASNQRRASVAAESEPAEPVAEKPAPVTSESDAGEQQAAEEPPAGEAEAGDEAQPVQEAPATEAAAEEDGEATPAEDGSAESDPQVAEEEQPPVEETTSEEPAPATDESSGGGEEAATDEGAEASTPTSEDAGSNGSEPSTGEGAEQPSAGGDEGATGDNSVEGGSGSAPSNGDAGSAASAGGSSSVESSTGTTATVEAPASTATTGSGTASGSGQAESTPATAPSESAASSSTNSSTGAAESGSGDASSDASTDAYFSDDPEPDTGD